MQGGIYRCFCIDGSTDGSHDLQEIRQYIPDLVSASMKIADGFRTSDHLDLDSLNTVMRTLMHIDFIRYRLDRHWNRSARINMARNRDLDSFARLVAAQCSESMQKSEILRDEFMREAGLRMDVIDNSLKLFAKDHASNFAKVFMESSLGIFESVPLGMKSDMYKPAEAAEIYRSMIPVLDTFEQNIKVHAYEWLVKDIFVSDILSVDFGVDTNKLMPVTHYEGKTRAAADKYWSHLTKGELPYKQ